MAKLVYGLNQSLDGYVDHMRIGPPSPALSRHFMENARGLTGAVYGRRMYEIMRYWDDDLPDWDAEDQLKGRQLSCDAENASKLQLPGDAVS